MLPICVETLSLAAKILISRLHRPSTIDISIIQPKYLTPGYQIDKELAKTVGCFATDGQGLPCFLLAARRNAGEKISHIYVYYINRNHKVVQDDEIKLLKKHVSYMGNSDNDIKLGVVNLFCGAPQVYFLSALIEGVDYTIGGPILTSFKKHQGIRINLNKLYQGPLPDCNLSHCDGKPTVDTIESFEDPIRRFGKRVDLGDARTNLRDPDVVWIRDNGHLVGSFYCKQTHTVNYLLVHRNQFLDDQTYDRIKNMTRKWYTNGDQLSFVVTRFYPNTHRRCDDDFIRMAWELICWIQPHVLISIQENELNHLIGNYEAMNRKMTELLHRQVGGAHGECSQSQTLSQMLEPPADVDSQPVEIELQMNSQQNYPDVLFADEDVATEYQSMWVSDLTVIQEVSRERRRIKDSIIPPVHVIPPTTDLTQGYLMYMPCYYNGVELMSQIWNRYAHTVAFGLVSTRNDLESRDYAGAHFLICPAQTPSGYDCLIIIDQAKKKWIYISPDNVAYKDPVYFADIVRPKVLGLFPDKSNYNGLAVPLTSYFHEDCPRLHLLVALYVISRLFHYVKELPQKIIYGDWELRKYAHEICEELKLSNALYNASHGLLDDKQRPREGAYMSLQSPLVAESMVVPKDQCMLCKRRYKGNLGRHIAADHAKQAAYASHCRLELEHEPSESD